MSEPTADQITGYSRREFIKRVIASGATVSAAAYLYGGLTGCSRKGRAAGGVERLISLNVNGQVRRVDVLPSESLAMTLRENNDNIRASTAAIAANSQAIRQSTDGTAALVPALQGVERLREPMAAVAALDPTLKGVAGLREPMGRVADLDPPMRALAALQAPMSRLVEIRPGLEATAALGPSMDRLARMRPSLEAVALLQPSLDRVSELQPQLAAVANLSGSMDQLAGLRAPMERLAGLEEPMSRLAGLSSLLDRPVRLALFSLIALLSWGIVTFLAVRFAIISASRRSREGA
jgi:hypothetical protein